MILQSPLPAVGLGACEDAVGSMVVVEPPLCVTGTVPRSLMGTCGGGHKLLLF